MIGTGQVDSREKLRRLESVTDANLSELGVDEMLPVLLDRVRELLGVEAAGILLYDEHAQQLVVTAMRGFNDHVPIGFRVAVGRGVAGRVAEQRTVIVVEDVAPNDIVSPGLRGKGLRSVAAVPMLAAGELVGVLQVATARRRSFGPDEIQLLQLAADRAAMASQARLGRIDREAALALQRGLLPTRPPALPGVELAARYVPGHDTGVGGDWYDVFGLPGGWIGVVVGDVTGHGLPAAVVMGRLRSALRAYALECADPADALTRLDRKIRHFEAGNLTTALYAMIAPERDEMRISLAGHPPPIMAAPNRRAEMLSLPTDLPLGTGVERAPRRTTSVGVPADALLVCYTDGLVERRGQSIAEGLRRLTTAVKPGPAQVVCAEIMAAMDTEHATDDVAILALRRPPAEQAGGAWRPPTGGSPRRA